MEYSENHVEIVIYNKKKARLFHLPVESVYELFKAIPKMFSFFCQDVKPSVAIQFLVQVLEKAYENFFEIRTSKFELIYKKVSYEVVIRTKKQLLVKVDYTLSKLCSEVEGKLSAEKLEAKELVKKLTAYEPTSKDVEKVVELLEECNSF